MKENFYGAPWTYEEEEIIREHYGKKTTDEIQEIFSRAGFNRSVSAIRNRGRKFQIKGKRVNGEEWTRKEIKIIAKTYPIGGVALTMKRFKRYGIKRSVYSIRAKACEMGLRSGLQSEEHYSLYEFLALIYGENGSNSRMYKRIKKFLLENDMLVFNEMGRIKYCIKDEDAYKILDKVYEDREKANDPDWIESWEAADMLRMSADAFRTAILHRKTSTLHKIASALGIKPYVTWQGTQYWWKMSDIIALKREWEAVKNEPKNSSRNAGSKRGSVLQVRVHDRAEQGRRETSNGHYHASIE